MEDETKLALVSLSLLALVVISVFYMAMAEQSELEVRQELLQFKEQAFSRGHMVQCLGRTGYYLECD